jgi:tetratricopeptide (TPR) repeat protein
VEILKQLLGSDPDERMASLGLDASSNRAIHAVLGDSPIVASVDEIASAMRRVLEAVAADAPLVVVLDDIHWGEDVFLDLVDHIADLSRDAPILLLCMARPELLDRRPGWGGGKLNATAVLLEPLGASDADALVSGLLDGTGTDDALRARILEAAEGNPLFVEEMVALVRDSPDRNVAVPPTIQALLAARLDQLDPAERAVLERGSVEGRVFHRGAVQALSPAESPLGGSLTALVRRELLRPDRPQFAGEDAYRFRHLLIRDAAYDALPKSTRADLHERFADWIDERGTDLVEVDEIVGYHLERAYGYRVELGPVGEGGLRLSTRAATRLAAAGGKAAARGDARAVTNLLGRAVALFPSSDPRRLAILPQLGRALNDAGQWDRAEAVLTEAVETGLANGDRGMAADAAVARTDLRIHRSPNTTHKQVRAELADAVSVFEELGNKAGLARALTLAGQLRFWAGESAAAIDDLEQAANHARAAGDRFQELYSLGYVAIASLNGPEPVTEALERNGQLRLRVGGASTRIDVTIIRSRAYQEAMRGHIDDARDLVNASLALATELGLEVGITGVLFEAGEIELLADDPQAAEQFLRPAVDQLLSIGDQGHFVTIAPVLAESLLAQGKDAEAEALIELVEQWAIEDDLDPQISMRRVRSLILARRNEFDEAERVARRAVELADGTDFLDIRARTVENLGYVLRLAGRADEAVAELRRAIALHEQKGNIVAAARATAALSGAPTTHS